MTASYDYIIVGSGIAGLYAALLAREHGSVLVLTKGSIDDCNTRWAQGGIAAPIGAGDSAEKHLRDTIEAGAGLVDEEAARVLTSEAAARIEDLVRLGVPFDTSEGEIALAREGAHSEARVLHAGGDSTGAHIELTLASLARRGGVTVLREHDRDGNRKTKNGKRKMDGWAERRWGNPGAQYPDGRGERVRVPSPYPGDRWGGADVSRVDEPGGGDG